MSCPYGPTRPICDTPRQGIKRLPSFCRLSRASTGRTSSMHLRPCFWRHLRHQRLIYSPSRNRSDGGAQPGFGDTGSRSTLTGRRPPSNPQKNDGLGGNKWVVVRANSGPDAGLEPYFSRLRRSTGGRFFGRKSSLGQKIKNRPSGSDSLALEVGPAIARAVTSADHRPVPAG